MATQYTAGLTAGQVLTAATMNSIGAAWETFTPTLFNGTTSVTLSTAEGFYCRINKLAIVHIRLTVSGTGTTGAIEVRNLPAAIEPKRTGGANNASGAEVFAALYYDDSQSVSKYNLTMAYPYSSTVLRIFNQNKTGDDTTALASPDRFAITGMWERA